MTTLALAIVLLPFLCIVLARRVSYALRIALAGYLIFWMAIPFGYRLVVGADPVGSDISRLYNAVAMAHAAGVAATILAVLFVPSPFSRVVRETRLARWQVDEGILRLSLLILAGLIVWARLWQFRSAGGNFASVVALNISRDRESIGSFTLVSAAAGAYLSLALATVASGRALSIGTRLIGWVCITIVAGQVVLMGQRSFMLLPFLGLFLLAGTTESRHRHRAWLVAWGAGVVALVLLPVAAAVVGVTRAQGGEDSDRAGSALEALAELEPSERVHLFAAAANLKFDDVTTGANLLALDGPGGGGLRPLTSALLSPVPRLLLPYKPVPISSNGEQSGVPFVRAADRFGAIETGMVVPVSPAAVTVWELGWWGLLVFVAANVLVLWLVEAWLRTGAVLPGAFAFAVLSYPTFEFAFQSPSSLVRDLLRLGIAWAALTLVALAVHQKQQVPPPLPDP